MTTRFRRFTRWVRWVRQGRPRTVPVVLKPGTLLCCEHGFGLMTGWDFDPQFMNLRIENGVHILDTGHVFDVLGAQYGVTRVKELDCCLQCRSYVTA